MVVGSAKLLYVQFNTMGVYSIRCILYSVADKNDLGYVKHI